MQFYYVYRSENQIGPLNADEFMMHVEQRKVRSETPVLSPELTNNQWTTLAAIDIELVKQTAAPLRRQRLAREQEERSNAEVRRAAMERERQQAAEAKRLEGEIRRQEMAASAAQAEKNLAMAEEQRYRTFEPRTFPALEIYKSLLYGIAIVLWILAGLSLVSSCFMFILSPAAGFLSLVAALVWAVILFLWGIGLAFVAQLISVFTSIESNTHEAAFYTRILYADWTQDRGKL